MPKNPLQQLHDLGQSIWLDSIDRPMLESGDLAHRIERDALTGLTSNPTIFEKAVASSAAYDAQLAAAPAAMSPRERFELIASQDIRAACDLFRPVYDRTAAADGYASIEVAPDAAHDADRTIAGARRLWALVGRPNVMIKVPGTTAGAVAVRQLIGEGLNINITLLFSRDAYRAIIEAYFAGLEDRVAAGQPIDRVASVASFFVSRVDTAVDKRIATRSAAAAPGSAARLGALPGRAAVANAKLAYALFQEQFAGPRWERLAAHGAQRQRPLWASTSTKNPAYRDVMYVEQLIGPETVDTMPPATIDAFRDHGVVARTIDVGVADARAALAELTAVGISLDEVTDELLTQGLASFEASYDALLERIEEKTGQLQRGAPSPAGRPG